MNVQLVARLAIGIGAIVALTNMVSDKKAYDSEIDNATIFLLGMLILVCLFGG